MQISVKILSLYLNSSCIFQKEYYFSNFVVEIFSLKILKIFLVWAVALWIIIYCGTVHYK